MKPVDYLTSLLQRSAEYATTDAERFLIATKGLENFIYAKLTSKKFRKWALERDAESHTRRAISLSVAQNKPIRCVYPFGGYKLWRIPGSPEVDLAEFFSLSYYIKYLAPIAATYKPGVILTFSSDDAILERMNNIPAADTKAYLDSFSKLIENFRPFLPVNLKIEVVRTGDLYEDKSELERELISNIPSVTAYFTTLDEAEKERTYKAAELNMYWNGLEDLTHLSAKKRRSVIEAALLYHGAYCQLKKRLQFNRSEEKVIISPEITRNAIAIGTTKNGVTKFTTGMGVLKRVGDTYKKHILSPSNLDGSRLQYISIDSLELSGLKNAAVLDE